MGIDVHGLNFLRYAKKYRNFGKSITIGRQGIHVIEPLARTLLAAGADFKNETYCEQQLINYFGANSVDSIDNSSYENASIIHDMNLPLPSDLLRMYDTIIDGGCLEHIYNIPQALINCSLLCKPGGQIIHILPSNNFCGHGFWQFSPELFFSLYSNKNGYQDTEVFLADLTNTSKWFKVKQPTNGQRVYVLSSTKLYVLVRTVLKGVGFLHNNVQQSDYIYNWSEDIEKAEPKPTRSNNIKQTIKQSPLFYSLLSSAYHFYAQRLSKLNKNNPSLSEINIETLLT